VWIVDSESHHEHMITSISTLKFFDSPSFDSPSPDFCKFFFYTSDTGFGVPQLFFPGHIGSVNLHFTSIDNEEYIKRVLSFRVYLGSDAHAFRRYRDAKVKGAELARQRRTDQRANAAQPMQLVGGYKTHKSEFVISFLFYVFLLGSVSSWDAGLLEEKNEGEERLQVFPK
jgi:hypothetical protein